MWGCTKIHQALTRNSQVLTWLLTFYLNPNLLNIQQFSRKSLFYLMSILYNKTHVIRVNIVLFLSNDKSSEHLSFLSSYPSWHISFVPICLCNCSTRKQCPNSSTIIGLSPIQPLQCILKYEKSRVVNLRGYVFYFLPKATEFMLGEFSLPIRKLALDADCPNCCSMYLALKVNRPMKELNFRMLPQRSRKYAGVPNRRFSEGRNPVEKDPAHAQVWNQYNLCFSFSTILNMSKLES